MPGWCDGKQMPFLLALWLQRSWWEKHDEKHLPGRFVVCKHPPKLGEVRGEGEKPQKVERMQRKVKRKGHRKTR